MGIISVSIWGSFQGWGSLRGRDHFGGCTAAPVVFRVWAMVLTQVSYWAFSQLSSFSRLVLSGLSDPTVGSLKTIAKLFFRICFAYLAVIKSSVNTVEPRFNEPLFNEVLDITNDFLCPSQSYSKMHGIEPRYNEFFDIANIIRKPKRKIYLDLTNYTRQKINAEQINS